MILSTVNNLGQQESVTVDCIPTRCPRCHRGIEPLTIGPVFRNASFLQRAFRCPSAECQKYFIAEYRQSPQGSFRLVQSLPQDAQPQQHSQVVKEISPIFCTIYDQARRAEELNLTLVCGPGYRKALEFLIKDYLIRQKPTETDKVNVLQLGKCIQDHVSNDKLKSIASRAIWLGNDETHYTRKWEGKDLQDLKLLVNLTVNWIEMEESTAAIMRDMP